MGIEVQTKKIGGFTFKMSQLPAWSAFSAFHRFLGVAGPLLPALGTAFRAVKDKKPGDGLSDDAQAQILTTLTTALPDVLTRCKPDELRALAEDLLRPCIITTPDGKSAELLDVMDNVLTGKLPVLLQLLAWAVAVHFGGFFAGLGSIGAPAAPVASP